MRFVCLCSLLVSLISGCGVSPSSSDLEVHENHDSKQFEPNSRFRCDIIEDSVDAMEESYGSFFYNGNNDIRRRAFEVLTRMPSATLEFVYTEHEVPTYLRGYGSGGLTYRRGFPYTPTRIESGVRSRNGNWDAFPHEFGHASHGFMQRFDENFEDDLRRIYRYAAVQGHETRYMRNYARTNEREFFAEFFDQYFCSQEARDSLQEKFPETWATLSPYLAAVAD